MKNYQAAIEFEKACGVRRLLEYVGKSPSQQDDLYIKRLAREMSDMSNLADGAPELCVAAAYG